MLAIASSSLSKTYRSGIFRREEVIALRDFSLEVPSGMVFSLLGPNGAGKTTFIKILLSLSRPTSGEVHLLGERLPNTKVRERVGYLPENHRYPGYLTGGQVLSAFGRLAGVSPAVLHRRIPELLELVGMSAWPKMKVRKYSKGMMQRLGLAQALVNNPDLLFLDEPTDGVDPIGRKEIRDILKNLRNQGKTIFLNSHLLSEVELISDQVAILDRGRLLKVGTVDELTTSERIVYTIGIEGALTDGIRQEAAAMVMKLKEENGRVVAELGNVDELKRVIDLFRKHGITVTSVVRQKNSLEESFITLIKREVAS